MAGFHRAKQFTPALYAARVPNKFLVKPHVQLWFIYLRSPWQKSLLLHI